MRNLMFFILACSWAALVPLLAGPRGEVQGMGAVLPWPTHWESRPLRLLPLTSQEMAFFGAVPGSTPGSIARFTDGSMEILFRRVDRPTRKLHPSSDCLRALGYSIHPLRAESAAQGGTWSCFQAKRKDGSLRVREMVVAGNGVPGADGFQPGESWTDVSSWYWNALWGKTQGPWTAITLSRME